MITKESAISTSKRKNGRFLLSLLSLFTKQQSVDGEYSR